MKFLYVWTFLFLIGCNSEDGSDCFKKQGTSITQEIFVEPFTKINIGKGIELIIEESDEESVKIIAGRNLINDVKVEVINGELFAKDENGCEIMRNTFTAKLFVSVPNLERIYSSSQFSVRSDGVLTFPHLELVSGIITEDSPASVFDLEINNESLTINDNVSSVFKIKGHTQNLTVNFWGSNGRFEGANLHAEEITVFHRSTNDMIVFPLQKISGTLYSTGNMILKNLPPEIDLTQVYTGQVIYP